MAILLSGCEDPLPACAQGSLPWKLGQLMSNNGMNGHNPVTQGVCTQAEKCLLTRINYNMIKCHTTVKRDAGGTQKQRVVE